MSGLLARAARRARAARVRGVPRAARRARASGCARTARARCRGCARGCPRCGAAVATAAARCPAARAAFPRAWAPVAYEGVARELVGALKFRGALPVADLMAAHMAANLPAGAARSGGAALVPVPGRSRRPPAAPRVRPRARAGGRARAPRSSGPLADCLARATARRARSARAAARAARPAGSSCACAGHRRALALLVDDVHTTGATLDACARALVAGGTTVVAAISYARTL